MKIKFIIKSNQFPATVYIRFSMGRLFDITASTPIVIDPAKWNPDKQEVTGDSSVNSKLLRIKSSVLSAYSSSLTESAKFDAAWLKKAIGGEVSVVKKNMPDDFLKYAKQWLKEKAPKWKTGHGKTMSEDLISQYEGFLSIFKSFRDRLDFSEIDNDILQDFADYLSNNGYSKKTVTRHLGRFRFFCLRAESDKKEIDKTVYDKVYVDGRETSDVFLTMDEIESVYNLDFADDILDACRDTFVLSCLSGLRVSDAMGRLDDGSIQENRITLTTTKTGQQVWIPIHPLVKKILDKRGGLLPMKVSHKTYNLKIKEICRLANIDFHTQGNLWDDEKQRKVFGTYPKWMLVSSHTARRSLATFLKGKVSDETIAAIMGWRSTAMVKTYDKTTLEDHAVKVEQIFNQETLLKIA